MRVAYVFSTAGQTIDYILGDMILPQLERRDHGVEVAGMFFFHDNTFVLRSGDPLGERLAAVATEQNILLMACDRCATKRGLADPIGESESGRTRYEATNVVEGATVGCFPDLYEALSAQPPEHVITL